MLVRNKSELPQFGDCFGSRFKPQERTGSSLEERRPGIELLAEEVTPGGGLSPARETMIVSRKLQAARRQRSLAPI